MPSLYVDQQEIIGFKGGSVTIWCHCSYPVNMVWCKLGSSCVTDHSGSIDETNVTFSNTGPDGFSVTMSKLKLSSSGWYWCSTANQKMPVHISVHEPPSTTTTKSPSTTITLSTAPVHLSSLTNAETLTVQPANSTTSGGAGECLQDIKHCFTEVIIVVTILIVVLLVVAAALIGWRTIRRNKAKPEESHITMVSQTGSDPDVLYSIIVRNQHTAEQKKGTRKG
ncbi:hypothetical protein LDENG_00039240 [Lucifuga dentata]|nr:hypothetical protein LDENG_00039240 [Lucifuga dentata]